MQASDTYQLERMTVPAAAGSDFVFVNLFRAPAGGPMRLDAVNELISVRREGGRRPRIKVVSSSVLLTRSGELSTGVT